MFGLDKDGFKRKRYKDIREDLAKKWKESFGEDSRTEEKSINGIIISLISFVASQLWMLAEKVYNSGFVHKAEGVPLGNQTMNRLVQRRSAEKATGEIEITGDEGTEIESGFRVSNDTEYVTIEDVEIGENGTVMAKIEAEEAGVFGNVEKDTVTDIDTPIVGVDIVTNPKPISGGRDAETDTELRERFELSLSAGGSPTENGIRAEVLGVEGVRTVNVISNNTNAEKDGRPEHSFETYVLGGEDEDVAQAIFNRRAAGIQPYGDTTIDVKDDSGNVVPVGFTRAEEIDIYFEVEFETNNEFTEDGNDKVRTAIIEYVGGLDYDGNEYTGLQVGKDMYFTRVIGEIDRVTGVENITKLKIGTDPNDLNDMQDIEIGSTEVAQTDYEKIDIL